MSLPSSISPANSHRCIVASLLRLYYAVQYTKVPATPTSFFNRELFLPQRLIIQDSNPSTSTVYIQQSMGHNRAPRLYHRRLPFNTGPTFPSKIRTKNALSAFLVENSFEVNDIFLYSSEPPPEQFLGISRNLEENTSVGRARAAPSNRTGVKPYSKLGRY